jgi:hypothetical protein
VQDLLGSERGRNRVALTTEPLGSTKSDVANVLSKDYDGQKRVGWGFDRKERVSW